MLTQSFAGKLLAANGMEKTIKVNGHLWLQASKLWPNWDCTPNLETVFADVSYAGIDGVKPMDSTLRYDVC